MIYKAHMARFLQRVKWRAMAWIDSDMIAVAPLGGPLSTLLAELAAGKREVAICREEGLATFGTIGASGAGFDHFARAVAKAGADLATPYYNTGIFACRTPDFLSEWSERALLEPPQTVFDQNVFNLVLHRRGAPIDLDPKAWNVHGSLLAAARVVATEAAPRVRVDGTETLIVHATSSRREDIINAHSFDVAGVRLNGQIYLCRNPQLQALQQALMTEAFTGVADKLRRLGIAEPLPPAS
jgi:hypothetical protein